MNHIFKLLLIMSATSYFGVIYLINRFESLLTLILLLIPIVTSGISILLTRKLDSDLLPDCKECSLADNEFLSVYLGYFFVALSIRTDSWLIFTVIGLIIFAFTFVSQTQYFNPLFLLFGYHFYHVLTNQGTRIFIIVKGKIIRNIADMPALQLKRINDTTFIGRRIK